MPKLSVDKSKRSKDYVRASLSPQQQKAFDLLVKETGEWSEYFYGTKQVSYVILAELVKSGWAKG